MAVDLARTLRERVGPVGGDGRRLTGVEHEYSVCDRHGSTVDFRHVIRSLDLDGRALDPGDPLAVRGRWGGVITADGAEAEVATPPVVLEPGFTTTLADWSREGVRQLQRAAPELALEGYSTHLSIQVDDRRAVRAARRFAHRFSLAQMLLMDRPSSPGLLVRPRRHRLELCGEFVEGHHLRAAAVFAGAATLASLRPAPKHRYGVGPFIAPATGRFGYYVDRRAFGGVDLYEGRAARITPGLTAQDVLERSWEAVRPHAVGLAAPDEVRMVDGIVAGELPLPLEADAGTTVDGGAAPGHVASGRLVDVRRRGDVVIWPAVATWRGTAFVVERGNARFVITVPLAVLDPFLVALDGGELDDVVTLGLAPRKRLPVLATASGLESLGVFADLAIGPALALDERDPVTGRLRSRGDGGRHGRDHKHEQRSMEPSASAPRPRRGLVLAAILVATVLLLGGVATAMLAGTDRDDDDQEVSAGGPPTSDGGATPGRTVTLPVACTLLDESGVQALTGLAERFIDSGSGEKCFWGTIRPGFGSYVEITLRRSSAISRQSFAGCTTAPVPGVGEAAVGATCPGTQTKVWLLSFDRGVSLDLLVNDPVRTLTPADLGAVADQMLASL